MMDNARKSTRLFPGYTLAELERRLPLTQDQKLAARLALEIERRKNGQSKAFVVPQILGHRK